MKEASVSIDRSTRATRAAVRRRGWVDMTVGYLLALPAIVYILLLVGYPFLLSLYFSVNRVFIGGEYQGFAGIGNFAALLSNPVFHRAFWNTLGFTFLSEIAKAILGIGLAFLLLQPLFGKKVVRAFLMLPFTLPFALSLLGWQWMYDPTFSVINYLFGHDLHILRQPYPDWLGDPFYSWLAILIVNIWRGFPFAGVIILAGLTSIPGDLLDAAKVDGAGFFKTWHYVITPIIAPILFIGLIYDITFTIGDLTAVYRLTQGGPGFATETLPMEAWQVGIVGGNLGAGSAITLFLFPFLLVGVVVVLRMLYRRESM